ncbi:MAG: class I SAM-dependent methyltransferase [Acidobacteriaceae bacterium]|nr:class I SAM-dependent methyltransferase [Acidobacteriaceae bacterium]MBV9779048.1 class I SAM-dependent methyltransferase [Acidobacteriaceae bacterium]
MVSTDYLFEKYYYSNPTFADGTATFHELCNAVIPRATHILEIGAGFDNMTSAHLARLGTLVAVDISEEVRLNSNASAAIVYDGKSLPFEDASFHSCVSDYVIEHIEEPGAHFREVARVLKPGGHYCFRTPNRFHYVAFASWLLPHGIHRLMSNPLRGRSADAPEPYPTHYRANTRAAVRRVCRKSNLDIQTMLMVEAEPSYGRCHPIAFMPMVAYERIVNRWSILDQFRANIFCVARKRALPRST